MMTTSRPRPEPTAGTGLPPPTGQQPLTRLAHNFRLAEALAAIGRRELARVEALIQQRIAQTALLLELLADVPQLRPADEPAGQRWNAYAPLLHLQLPRPRQFSRHLAELLQGFAEVATAADALAVRLDARHHEPSPAGFLGGLRQALDLPEDGSPIETLAERGQAVLLVDTYEAAAAVDDWVRDELLPTLPAGVLVVLAGREPPPPDGGPTTAGVNCCE